MNKILIGVGGAFAIAIIYLMVQVNSLSSAEDESKALEKTIGLNTSSPATIIKPEMQSNTPTGKIAFVNIDKLNDESLEIKDLVDESKKRKSSIESGIESLSAQYQKKMEEYQTSAKAGIAPESEMKAKEKEILALQKEAENRQAQMDNLSMDINEKNGGFQKSVRVFLQKWNNGKYDYILSYSDAIPSMLLGNASLEVTNEIIISLNEEYTQRKSKK